MDELDSSEGHLIRLAALVLSYDKQLHSRLGTRFAGRIWHLKRAVTQELREELEQWNDALAIGREKQTVAGVMDLAKEGESWMGKNKYWVVSDYFVLQKHVFGVG